MKTPIQPEDLFHMQFIRSAQVSPCGDKVVYALSTVDPDDEKETLALWLLDLKSGDHRQFTSGLSQDFNPTWSQDGKQIAFLSSRDGPPQVYLQSVEMGEANRLTNFKLGVTGGPVWSPDGSQLAILALTGDPPDPNKPYRVTRPIYRFNAVGYLEHLAQNIFTVQVENGETNQLTDDDWMKSQLSWSPDGEEILFVKNLPPDNHNIYDFTIQTVNLARQVKEVVPCSMLVIAAKFSPDGKHIVFSGTEPGKPVFSKTDLWIIGCDGQGLHNRSEHLDYSVTWGLQADMPERLSSQIVFCPDGQYAYVDVQVEGDVCIYEISLQGKPTWKPIVVGPRCNHLVGKTDERLVYASSSPIKPSDFYSCFLDGSDEIQHTKLHTTDLDSHRLPEVMDLWFSSEDGQPVQGWLMKPINSAQKPFPTILYIHGGPQTAFGNTYMFDFNMLAAAGYAVLYINPRGSTGYGDAFTTAIIGDWGNLDYKDLMAGVDHAVDSGLSDPNYLGVTGASYGGYMTSWIIGQTDRFRAAVIESPIVDLVSTYGTSDLGAYFCSLGLDGKPHEVPDTYRRCSPITYAHRSRTPTLLIHGENDLRSPIGQTEQFYTSLKANGCIVEMLRLPNSHHGGTFTGPIASRKAQNEALLDWMNRYVLGKSE